MKIRAKVGITLFVTIALFFSLLALQLASMLKGEYRKLEIELAERNIVRAANALDTEIDRLRETANDYASWDDTWNFIVDRNEEYLESNYPEDNFVALKLNIVLLMDRDGEVAFGKYYDWQNEAGMEMTPEFLAQFTAEKSPFRFKEPTDGFSGLLNAEGKYFLAAARPIITSEREGPVRGTLIFAREFDMQYVQSIANRTGLTLYLQPPEIFEELRSYLLADDADAMPRAIKVMDENTVSGFALFRDLYNNPVFLLRLDLPRDIYKNGQKSIAFFSVALFGLGVVLTLAVFIVGNIIVISPLRKLVRSIDAVKKTGRLSGIVRFNGNDEVSELSGVLSDAFHSIEGSEKKLRDYLNSIKLERNKLDVILQSIRAGIFVLDEKCRIILLNEAFVSFSGYSGKEMFGRDYGKLLKFILEKDRTDVSESLKEVFRTGAVFTVEQPVLLVRKDGGEMPVSYSVAPIKNLDGKVKGCVVVLRDVTRERAIDKAKSEFVSIASHQLRTPLTGIKWMLELLKNADAGPLNDKQKEYLDGIHESNERMIKLVGQLLDVSRMETGRNFSLEMAPVDMKEIITQVVKEQEIIARQRNVSLVTPDKWPESTVVNADKQKFFEVLMNLVNNAIKYTHPDTTVEIGCKADRNSLVVSVKDQGIGIPKEQQPRMFEKFFRADNAVASQTVGTGLGLYAVKGITEAHGGKIWFESELNRGSTFYCRLPLNKSGATDGN